MDELKEVKELFTEIKDLSEEILKQIDDMEKGNESNDTEVERILGKFTLLMMKMQNMS